MHHERARSDSLGVFLHEPPAALDALVHRSRPVVERRRDRLDARGNGPPGALVVLERAPGGSLPRGVVAEHPARISPTSSQARPSERSSPADSNTGTASFAKSRSRSRSTRNPSTGAGGGARARRAARSAGRRRSRSRRSEASSASSTSPLPRSAPASSQRSSCRCALSGRSDVDRPSRLTAAGASPRFHARMPARPSRSPASPARRRGPRRRRARARPGGARPARGGTR